MQDRVTTHLCRKWGIENRQHSAIGCAANQTTKSLLQTNDGLRNAVFIEARAALILDLPLARSHNWIAGNGERQLIDDHTRQLRATHVNALPEARRREQHRIRRRSKLFQQLTLGRAALNKARIIDLRSYALIQLIHAGVAGRKNKGAAFRRVDDLDYFFRGSASPLR